MLTRRSLLTAGLALPALTLVAGASNAGSEPNTHQVEILDFEFNPSTLDVKPGDKVVFTNKDIVPHTATDLKETWDSGDLKTGDRWEFVVETTGTFEYFCRHHPTMLGSLISK